MDGRPVRCDPTDRRRAASVDRRTLGALPSNRFFYGHCHLLRISLAEVTVKQYQLTHQLDLLSIRESASPVKVHRSGIVRGNSKSAQTSYGRVRINPKGRTDRRRKGGKG
jgi:hypothetical protein